ncbi:hypothetical protein C8R45DRAFT_611141 [Mycena sanguinolenta]|nr:hypothetical protein C8R45DRAFT_611141 [Mycena sanguinolenta]
MADVEFHVPAPTREPTFIKPLDTASRRRSRASHDSAAASTRSWVLMNQNSPPPPAEPIPVPEPIPALAPTPASRPLPTPPRRTSAIGGEEEHMSVELPAMGYQWQTNKLRETPPHKGFVGGFVSGLRRLPRALVRTRRPRQGTVHTEAETEGTEQTGAMGNTLPRYVSNPTTPVVPNTTVTFARNADAGRQPLHPSFRIVPPAEDVEQAGGDAQQQQRGTMLEFPETPLENPYDREATSVHGTPLEAPSPHPSRADDHLAVTHAELDNDEPVSVQAHPQPSADYRRMSAADAAQPQSRRTTITSGSSSNSSPSFSAELNVNGMSRFLDAFHLLPWVAAERITADYEPKQKRPGVSWYYPKGESDALRALQAAASPASPPRTRSPPRHRPHRRRSSTPPVPVSVPPTTPAFPIAYYPSFAPSPPPPPAPTQAPRSRREPSPPPRRTHARTTHRHHRRSATYHSPQPVPVSMPAPWVSPQLLPVPPAPVYIIQPSPAPTSAATPSPPPLASAPIPPPAPPSSSAQATSGSGHGTPGSGSLAAQPLPYVHPSHRSHHSGSRAGSGSGSGSGKAHPHAQMLGLGLAPVYMQMQVVPLSPSPSPSPAMPGSPQPQQVAFVAGDVRYPYGYPYPYGYGVGVGATTTYSGGWSGSAGSGSPIAMPAPVQTVPG